jgi:hypothetical protein
MSFVIAPAPICLAVDLLEPLSASAVAAIKARGGRVAFRYANNLTLGELRLATDMGLGIGIVAESRAPGWHPSAVTGAQDAEVFLDRVHGVLALPVDLTLFDDIESPDPHTDATDMIAHVDTCSGALAKAGDIPGVYIGQGPILSGDEWGDRPNVHAYWKSASLLADRNGFLVEPFSRSWQVIQGLPLDYLLAHSGPEVDFDFILEDRRGSVPRVVWAEGLQPEP